MKVVLVHGCFDILHIGHFEHFRAARDFGDRLIVSVTAERWVRKNKGEGHPAHSDAQRISMLRDLRTVDEAWICDDPGASPAILKFKPAFFVKGVDYAESGLAQSEVDACKSVGAEIVYTTTSKTSVKEMVSKFWEFRR